MDGWETRRKRKPGHDFCIIELAVKATIEMFDVDTAFFTGNYPPSISIQACDVDDDRIKNFSRKSVLGSEASANQEALAKISDVSFLVCWKVHLNFFFRFGRRFWAR